MKRLSKKVSLELKNSTKREKCLDFIPNQEVNVFINRNNDIIFIVTLGIHNDQKSKA